MHGVELSSDLMSDPIRLGFIQRALDSASLIIQTQFESETFRKSFHYTMVRYKTLIPSNIYAEIYKLPKNRITTGHLHTTP